MSSPPPDLPTGSPDLAWEASMQALHYPTLLVADEIGLFSLLDKNPATPEEVRQAFGFSSRAAETLLGVLASTGHIDQQHGRFHLTESSRQFLLPESPYYRGGMFELHRKKPVDHTMVKEALFKDAPTVNAQVFNPDMWESADASEANAEQLKAFTDAMHSLFFPAAMSAATHGDFDGVENLLDIAGGSGCFCIALALRYPQMGLTVLELPAICPHVTDYARTYGVEDRIRTVAGDMFRDDWPGGYDAHFISNIFHDWGVEKCLALAARSFAALPSGGRIYLHESLLDESRDGPWPIPLYSMTMVLNTEGGKQYTATELKSFLTDAGFEDVRVSSTYAAYSLVSARKP